MIKRAMFALLVAVLLVLVAIPASADGGKGNDVYLGTDDGNSYHGGPGADYIRGNRGSDSLWGDAGADRIKGGDGRDVCFVDVLDTVSGCEEVIFV